MVDWILPVVYALFLWWSSTVVVLYLNGLSRSAARRSFWGASLLALVAVAGIAISLDATTSLAAVGAFTAGVVVWGWHEVSYYAGVITGPRSVPCPPGSSNWERFRGGVGTCLHHEFAVIATGVVLGIVSWTAANPVAFWTYAILWLMRWSAKLNIFLGVRNLHTEFWPEHLRFLTTYARRRVMNPLYPLSMAAAGAVLAVLILSAIDPTRSAGQATGLVLVATLQGLAILEHALLMAPISDDAVWQLGMRSHRTREPDSALPARANRL